MGWFSWFKKRESDDDFETVLNGLEAAIRDKEERLAFIQQREKKSVVLVTSYSSIAWLIYVSLWWFGVLDWMSLGSSNGDGTEENDGEIIEKTLKSLPVAIIPVVIVYTRKIVKAYYARKRQHETKELQEFRKKQKTQIDKLKKLSNYDKITEMLQRHGAAPVSQLGNPGGPFQTPKGAKSKPGSAYSTPTVPGRMPTGPQGNLTPAQQSMLAAQRNIQLTGRAGLPGTPQRGQPELPNQLDLNVSSALAQPPQEGPKGFFDRLADAAASALLGDNEQSPASKYALICQKCFGHHGLVLKEELMDIQFLCPKCGHFNPCRRTRMTGAAAIGPSPTSPTPPSAFMQPSSRGPSALTLETRDPNRPQHPQQSQSPTTDIDTAPLRDNESDIEDEAEAELTSKPKRKVGTENLRKRGKGQTVGGTDMDLDD